ncbi:polysaccharide biosynthesis C-terminal domain-containing protein, partial [Candidatus Pacearchaeota archaeon]|nr:polysaccharide biosynthesis C-terminal domain-containing protein [Candidatus Pacearchaeota archaeon]
FISLIIFHLMAGLFITANDFIFVVYSAKWLPSVGPLKILCLAAALASVHAIAPSIFNSQGRPDIALKWNLFRFPFTILAIIIGAKIGSVLGVAYAMLISEIISIVQPYIAIRLIKHSFKRYFLVFLPSIISSTVMILLILLARYLMALPADMHVLRLVLDFIFGAGVYLLMVFVVYRKDFDELISFGRHIVKK